ncbi:MAG TPA: NAD(P)/FAD-dependent oxidoreductase [Bryobacteraceae bacterium]|nr:NAD(P)/FAD-dependent oxidoreductase [Bryobacteraceae bacterium]
MPAAVVGAGPNGLTAAIVLAQAGVPTTLFEAEETIGGGARSMELTLPGFVHDVCSAIHPMAVNSPAFRSFPLAEHGLEWIQPPLPVAHPFDDGSAAVLENSLNATCERLGRDGATYRRAVAPLVRHWPEVFAEIMKPLLPVPRRPLRLARFGLLSTLPSTMVARIMFRCESTRALYAGMAAHSLRPLETLGTAAFGWLLAVAAHAGGWPIPRGGSQKIADALASYFESLGGRIIRGTRVRNLDELGDASPILLDVTPRQLAAIGASRFPASYLTKLNDYRYGPGVFKIDWALHSPIPWRAPDCERAGTVHLGGTLEEIAASERGESVPPFVLVAQPSLFDSSRAPAGKHTAWAYCHVPNGSTADMTADIESQMERFAPGFRTCVLARHTFTAAEMEHHNANLVGGDITGGLQNIKQLLARPTWSLYRTPLKHVFLCSSSTPPGASVHGMCGFNAAQLALRSM